MSETINFKENELRFVMGALQECEKNEKCREKTGTSRERIRFVKCALMNGFGVQKTKDLEPAIHLDCIKRKFKK